MDPELWNHAARIFQEAVDLHGEARARHLEEVCGGRTELRALVERLLRADLDAATVLDRGPDLLAEVMEPEGRGPPSALGPYRVVRELGRGGMGAVYLAERADGRFDRRVAVKVVRGGFDSRETLARFRAEVRILAGLEHPDIARLYDAGVDDGRPYLVMEYVKGRRIDRYCDDAGLSVARRVGLFRKVCGAVQFAHQNLVIHRDLKPSNILVAEGGAVKLLDFGVARLMEEDPGRPETLTRRALTPDYASPEQLQGRPLSTASDVYSMGVVLYEVLTGRRPFDAPPGDLVALVESRGREPSSPSTVVTRPFEVRTAGGTTETVTPEDVATTRGVSPDRLRRELKGDLDRIVLRALHPDPAHRYPSVEALAEDLRRFQEGLPVSARPDSLGYRAATFVRRHRTGVVGAALIALALATTTAVATRQAVVAREERNSAQRAFAFLEDLLTSPNPFRDAGVPADSVRMIDFIDYAGDRIDEDLTSEPVARARMLRLLGTVYVNLGRWDEAVRRLEEAAEANRAGVGATSELVESLLRLGTALDQAGRREEGERLLRQALDLQLSLDDAPAARTAEIQEYLARALLDSRRLDEAEPLIEASLATRREVLGSDDPDVARGLVLASSLHSLRGEDDEAVPPLEEALDIYRRADLDTSPDFAVSQANLAHLYERVGRLEDADRAAVEAIRGLERTVGTDHFLTAATRARLAGIRGQRGRAADADSLFREAIGTLERVAPANVALVTSYGNYASLLRGEGRLASAENAALKARDHAGGILGQEHPLYAGALQRLGDILREEGRLEEAVELNDRALVLLGRALGPDHPQTQTAAVSLARSWMAVGRWRAADSLLAVTRTAAAPRGSDDPVVMSAEKAQQELAELRGPGPGG